MFLKIGNNKYISKKGEHNIIYKTSSGYSSATQDGYICMSWFGIFSIMDIKC